MCLSWQRPRLKVSCGKGLLRFVSCPSTLKTVHLLWLAWPHKWWYHLTDNDRDVKQPLRTTSSLVVAIFNVPISEYTHAGRRGTMGTACHFGLRGLGYVSQLLQCGTVFGQALHLHVHSLDPGVNGYLVGQRLLACLNSFQCHDGNRGCMLPRESSRYWNEQVPWPGKKL